MKSLLWFFCVYFFVIFVCIFSYRYENFIEGSRDIVIHVQGFWNAIQGKGFINTLEGHHFGKHFTPIQYLFLPFYYFFPSIYTLQALNILFFSLSLFPLYGILKGLFDPKISFFFILLFYIHPNIYSLAEVTFRDMSLLPFLFLSALYFYKKERFFPFLVFILLCNATKEIVAFSMAFFGFIAWKEKRPQQWILTPVGLSVAWLILSYKMIIPYFSDTSNHLPWVSHLGYLGNNLTDVVKNLVSFNFLSQIELQAKASYFLGLLLPFGFFIPFLSPYWIFALPDSAGIFFSKSSAVVSDSRPFGIIICIALFISFAHVIHRWGIFKKERVVKCFHQLFPLALLILFLFHMANFAMYLGNLSVKVNSRDLFSIKRKIRSIETYQKILEFIPPEASVSAPPKIANHLCHRETVHIDPRFDVAYLIVKDKILSPELKKQVANDKTYKLIFNENDWKIYQKQ